LTLQNTTDGSKTLYSDTFKETYHSANGAVTESMHVFIEAGFRTCKRNPLRIFEVGFGTGLNAFLTFIETQRLEIEVEYHSIELFPLENNILNQLEYARFLNSGTDTLNAIHRGPWDKKIEISPGFQLLKIRRDLLKFNFQENYDLVYFDAFSPSTQPELWSEEVLKKLYNHLNEGGILTTYCAKGAVRRTLEKVGFRTERLPGPPGKREMLRATK
jgi:tRNA U34 5-methylaminomethyl-2-thiouridine-forming methyltransferase MnmC